MHSLRRAWERLMACQISGRDLLIPLLLFVLASFTFFWRLGEGSLYDWDEAIYAQISQEMIWRHDLLTPTLAATPNFSKPPLHYWLTVLAYRVFGVNEFGARFWAALAGVGVVLMTYRLGSDLLDRATGLGAALLLLIVNNLPYSHGYSLVSIGRMGYMTVPIAFYALLSFWLAWKGQKDRRYLILLGLPLGAAVLTKSVVGLLPLGVLLAYWAMTWRLREWPWRELGLALVVLAALALPWHVVAALRYGRRFVDEYLLYHLLQRAFSTVDTHYHSQPVWYYLDTIRKGFAQAWVVLPLAGLYTAYRAARGREQPLLLLLLWALVPLGLYSLAKTKIGWYIIEAYPAYALLAGAFLVRVLGGRPAVALIVAFMVLVGWRLPSPRDGAAEVKRVAPVVRYLAGQGERVLLCMRGDDYYPRPATLFYAGRPVEHVTFAQGELARAWPTARFLLTDTDTWQAAGLEGEIVCRAGTQLLVRNP